MKKRIIPGLVIAVMTVVLLMATLVLPASAATSLKNAVVTCQQTYTYTGKVIKPTVTVKLGKKTINKKYYTVTYKNNKAVGKATVTIKGKGSYTGTASTSFYIRPKKVNSLKITPSANQVKLSWGKVTGAQGYQVFQYKNGKWVKLSNTKNTTYTVKNLDSATTYKFRLRAYKKAGKYLYSPSYTYTTVTTTLAKPTSLKASSVTETTASLSWKGVDAAESYEISLVNEVTGIEQSYKTSELSLELSSLRSFTDYTVKVRAYDENKNIYSAYSSYFAFKTSPSAITGFKAGAASSTSIKLSWDKKASVDGYQLFVNEYDENGNPTTYKKIGNLTTTSYTMSGVTPYRSYSFRVRAYDKASQGYVYSTYSESPAIATQLSKVSSFISTAKTNTSLSLSWSASPGATGYKLYVNGLPLTEVPTTTYTVNSLNQNTSYNFIVTAYYKSASGSIYESEKAFLTAVTDNGDVDSVEFIKKPASLGIGETATVSARVLPEYATNKSIIFTSGNTNVANISDQGLITAIAPGTTTITARSAADSTKYASYTLTVKNVVSTGISVPTSLTVNAGETAIISPTFTPANTTNKNFTVTGTDHTYTYKGGILGLQTKTGTCKLSDYISIGSNGILRGIKATIEPETNKSFSFTLTVKAADSGKTDTIKVTVLKKMVSVTYAGDDSPWYYGNSAKLSVTLDSSISSKYTDKDLRWSSSNTSVAKVSSDGTVSCVGSGEATITVSIIGTSYSGSYELYSRSTVVIDGNYFQGCKVGDTYQIKATLYPLGSTEKIKYYSANRSVADVSSTGLVTFKSPGSANIIVSTSVDSFNTQEVWLTSSVWSKPTATTKAQLYSLIKENADMVKTLDNLPGFNRYDTSTFTNFDLNVKNSLMSGALSEEDLYNMFGGLAAPKSFVQSPVYAGTSSYMEDCSAYMANVPVRGQNVTIIDGLDVNEDIKSIKLIDDGSFTYTLEMTLNEESFATLPTNPVRTNHGKVFDILTSSYLSDALGAINDSDKGVSVTYDSFAQRYHDSTIRVQVNKITGKVSEMTYDMNIDIDIKNLKLAYSAMTYTADLSFNCNNVVSFEFFGYKG